MNYIIYYNRYFILTASYNLCKYLYHYMICLKIFLAMLDNQLN